MIRNYYLAVLSNKVAVTIIMIIWRKGKRIGKKIKLIINTGTCTGIDIHDKRDLYMAEMAMRYQIKNNLMDH